LERLAELDQAGVDAQLQDGFDAVVRLCFDLFEGIQVPRIDDQRLFADHIRADAQGKAAV
jgi:hypothetical protein